MTGQAKLTTANGTQLQGYLKEAEGGTSKGAVVVIHEWWGLTDQVRGVADRLAREGFSVFAPDLYRGKVTKNADEAGKLMGALDMKQAVQDITQAAEALRQRSPGTQVAVLGFCMGGALTLAAAAKDKHLAAAVPFYGIPPEQVADVKHIHCPVLGHFATHDEWCSPERVKALEHTLKAAHVPAQFHHYDADHAFCNEQRPEVYSPENAELAWKRSVEFLHAKLG
ncbi:dienelactone hydrolase family protein [Melittangium boletus]|uniref:Dienelactone hydrolase n=1 Tax=Melittangium boletus DSM 14713 TaxID=1294270 RepID=A0A250IBL6_9BACT|nr:dienelactone hydrolase family protein [Melittangium boletus]ATB29145.1 dienelactone hydrolase [Melittangium boletus DSM 14713]